MQQARERIGADLAGFVAACLASAAVTATAADGSLEEIVVTGTRIVRPDFVSASPIVSVTQQRFEESSTNSVEAALNTMPQFTPSFGSTSNNPGNGGQANLSLRGLPNTATLVLLDGRRVLPANGSGVVDVNMIPQPLIESVEVITGGASAVYGSDAIAGVVNFKLRQDFDGVELNGMGGVTDSGDGEEYAYGVTAGMNFADGRGSVMGYAGYANRELVTHADRDFSRYALQPVGEGNGTLGPRMAFLPAGSLVLEEGSTRNVVADRATFDALFASYGYVPGTVPYSQRAGTRTIYNSQFGFNDDGTVFTVGALRPPVPGGVANFRGERDPVLYNDRQYGYNFATLNALQLPLERTSLFGRAEFELNEMAEFYAQAMYADYSVVRQLASTPVQFVTIPVTNPYIPADLATLLAARSNPSAPFEFAKRMGALGPRIADNQYDALQVTAGVQGRLGGEWRYDAYVQLGENEQEEKQLNGVRRSRFLDLVEAADGGVALCGGYNPFGSRPISQECADYLSIDVTNRTRVEQRIIEASASGPVLDLPAGPLQLAIGAMYKEDEYRYEADPIAKTFDDDGFPELIGLGAADDILGKDHNTDIYAEASLPLLRDVPAVKSLEAVVGYRWSDYASAGNVESYKAELVYEPVTPLRVRGSFQHAVRAPSVYELYLPQLGPDVGVDFLNPDPCSIESPERNGPDAARVEALCIAQGMPANVADTFVFNELSVPGVYGGNPDLKVETADTLTAGVVVNSWSDRTWLQNMQVSVDWYRIEIEDAIDVVFASDFIGRCYDVGFNPTLSLDNPYCTYFGRDTTNGTIRDAKEIYRNIGLFKTSGVDLQLDWSVHVGPGTASLNGLLGWTDSLERSGGPGLKADELVGLAGGSVGGSLPEWKASVRAGYSWDGIDAALQWRYVDSMRDINFPDEWTIPSRDYLDMFVSFDLDEGWLAGLRLNLGVENVADTSPPIFPSYVQANTDPSQYDTLGRRYFARATYRF